MNPGASLSDLMSEMPSSKTSISDLELLHRIAKEDEQALEVLYNRYRNDLYNYILGILQQNVLQSEELLQDVFLAVWASAGRFEGRASVKNWLFKIARNRAIAWIRVQRNTREDISTAEVEDFHAHNEHFDLEVRLIAQANYIQVRKALKQLPESQRDAIELFFRFSFSYQEISDIMECPLGTVKSRIYKAIHNLAGILKTLSIDD